MQQEPYEFAARPPRRPRPGSSSTTTTSTSRPAAGRANPARRVANEMRRDTNQLRQNDTFAVLFDTFHDRATAIIFYANSIGGFADSQITDEGPPNVDWNTVWSVRTADFDGGWTIEMAIPFKSLRYAPGREQTWGINLRRVVRWKNEWSYLAQVPRALTTFRGMLKVSSAGTLTGLEAPSGTRTIELKPYALGSVATDRTVQPPLSSDSDASVGGDVEVRAHPEPDRRPHREHRLRAGRGGRTAGQPHPLQPVLPREARLLPRGRRHVRIRRTRQRRAGRRQRRHAVPVLQPPHRPRRRPRDPAAGGRPRRRARRGQARPSARSTSRPATKTRPTSTSANFTVLRVKRDILGRSAIGAMFTHRTATPGRVGSNDGFGVDGSFGVLPEPARSTATSPRRRAKAAAATTSAIAGSSTTTPTATASRPSGSRCSPTSCPRWGSSAAPTSAATSACCASALGPKNVPHLRKVTTQASLNYTTNTENRLDTREQVGQLQTEFTNSDVAARHLHRHLRSPGAAVRHRSGHPHPGRRLRLSQPAAVLHRRPAAPALRRHRLRDGHVLQRHAPVAGAQHRARRVDAAVLASSRASR